MRRHVRWVTIALLVALIVINYIDRSAISYAIEPISKQFHIHAAAYGLISGAFSIGYMIFALLTGPMVDRWGARKVLLAGMLIWSIATAITPIAGGFIGLFILRIILGAGEAPGFPAATRTSSRWLPQRERGFGLSLIGGVAVSGSLLIGGPIVTQLISAITWRGMFWVLAGIGVLWAVVAAGLLYNTPNEHPRVSEAERAYITSDQHQDETVGHQRALNWRGILTNRNLWMVGAGYFAWGFIFWGFMYWLPDFLASSYHLKITAVGAFSVAPWAAGVAGALVGGILVDRIYARTQRIRSRFVIMGVALLLAGASLIPIVLAPSLTTALVFISLGVGFGFITSNIYWVAAIDAEPNQPASAAGFADACFALSGLVAPVIMGAIVQSTGTFDSGFLVMAGLAIVSAALVLFVTKESRRTSTPPNVEIENPKTGETDQKN